MMFIPSPATRNFGNKFNLRKKCQMKTQVDEKEKFINHV